MGQAPSHQPALHLVPAPQQPAEARPLRAQARVIFGPAVLDFHRLAAEFPAIQSGLTLAGDADLELQLACTGPQELRGITAALLRAGAAHVQVELVLRALTPARPAAAGMPVAPGTVPGVPAPAREEARRGIR
ncbi:hypothetical protein ACWEQL_33615 [Kitasatospora sp. NPDC004240]